MHITTKYCEMCELTFAIFGDGVLLTSGVKETILSFESSVILQMSFSLLTSDVDSFIW